MKKTAFKLPRKMPRKLLGNRLMIAMKPPEIQSIKSGVVMIGGRPGGEFENPNLFSAVVMQVGDKVTEDIKPGDKVIWLQTGGQDYFPGAKIVSVLDIVAKLT